MPTTNELLAAFLSGEKQQPSERERQLAVLSKTPVGKALIAKSQAKGVNAEEMDNELEATYGQFAAPAKAVNNLVQNPDDYSNALDVVTSPLDTLSESNEKGLESYGASPTAAVVGGMILDPTNYSPALAGKMAKLAKYSKTMNPAKLAKLAEEAKALKAAEDAAKAAKTTKYSDEASKARNIFGETEDARVASLDKGSKPRQNKFTEDDADLMPSKPKAKNPANDTIAESKNIEKFDKRASRGKVEPAKAEEVLGTNVGDKVVEKTAKKASTPLKLKSEPPTGESSLKVKAPLEPTVEAEQARKAAALREEELVRKSKPTLAEPRPKATYESNTSTIEKPTISKPTISKPREPLVLKGKEKPVADPSKALEEVAKFESQPEPLRLKPLTAKEVEADQAAKAAKLREEAPKVEAPKVEKPTEPAKPAKDIVQKTKDVLVSGAKKVGTAATAAGVGVASYQGGKALVNSAEKAFNRTPSPKTTDESNKAKMYADAEDIEASGALDEPDTVQEEQLHGTAPSDTTAPIGQSETDRKQQELAKRVFNDNPDDFRQKAREDAYNSVRTDLETANDEFEAGKKHGGFWRSTAKFFSAKNADDFFDYVQNPAAYDKRNAAMAKEARARNDFALANQLDQDNRQSRELRLKIKDFNSSMLDGIEDRALREKAYQLSKDQGKTLVAIAHIASTDDKGVFNVNRFADLLGKFQAAYMGAAETAKADAQTNKTVNTVTRLSQMAK